MNAPQNTPLLILCLTLQSAQWHMHLPLGTCSVKGSLVCDDQERYCAVLQINLLKQVDATARPEGTRACTRATGIHRQYQWATGAKGNSKGHIASDMSSGLMAGPMHMHGQARFANTEGASAAHTRARGRGPHSAANAHRTIAYSRPHDTPAAIAAYALPRAYV